MRNPWLDIAAADYVGHMSSPEVDQLSVLSQLLREALERFRPRDLLLLGCSTGNGLVHVDPAVTCELGQTIRSGGGLSVVLQRRSDVSPAVTHTKYQSLRQLERLFHFVEPASLAAHARACGFELQSQRIEPLNSGKGFDVLHFMKVTTRRTGPPRRARPSAGSGRPELVEGRRRRRDLLNELACEQNVGGVSPRDQPSSIASRKGGQCHEV